MGGNCKLMELVWQDEEVEVQTQPHRWCSGGGDHRNQRGHEHVLDPRWQCHQQGPVNSQIWLIIADAYRLGAAPLDRAAPA